VGTEVDGARSVDYALAVEVDYYIYHCADQKQHYRGAEKLLARGKPVIIAHPQVMGTNLKNIPTGCHVEINNRYVWRGDWRSFYGPYLGQFSFVLGSDAHQPNWLNHHVARYVARELGIKETLLF
jgi:hypothetical protein